MQTRRAITPGRTGRHQRQRGPAPVVGQERLQPRSAGEAGFDLPDYFNYCKVGEDGKTPAMRLGLARGRVAPEDIVYFTPEQSARRRSLPSSVRPEILRGLQP